MRIFRPSVLIAVATALCLIQPSLAASASSGQVPRIVPAHLADGLTGRQLAVQVISRLFTTSTTAPPVDCHYYGASGQILRVGNGATVCTTNYGEPVVAFFFSACDPLEAPPFFGETAQQQRHCAKKDLRSLTTFRLSVDGGTAVNLLQPRFKYVTPQVSVRLPRHNIFGVPAQRTTYVGTGYQAFIQNLSCGRHTIRYVIGFDGGTPNSAIVTVRVVHCGA
jgi:hypothetical protein